MSSEPHISPTSTSEPSVAISNVQLKYELMMGSITDELCKKFGLRPIPHHLLPEIKLIDNPELDAAFGAFIPLWEIKLIETGRPVIWIAPEAPFEAFVEEIGHFIHFHYFTMWKSEREPDELEEVIHPLQNYFSPPLWSDQLGCFTKAAEIDTWDDQELYQYFIMKTAFSCICEVVGTASRFMIPNAHATLCNLKPQASIIYDQDRVTINCGLTPIEIEVSPSMIEGNHDVHLKLPTMPVIDLIREHGLLKVLQAVDHTIAQFVFHIESIVTPLARHLSPEQAERFFQDFINHCSSLRTSPTNWIGAEVGAFCATRLLSDPESSHIFRDIAFTPHYGVEGWMKKLIAFGDGKL